jgi:hypothetical protein
MSVAYFVQSHRGIPQLLRLLSALRRGSPDAAIVVGHCPMGPPLPSRELSRLGAVSFLHRRQARRGHWSLLEPYFDAVELLGSRGVAYEWLVYLSGQDYPVRPPAAIEEELRTSPHDAYLTWRRADEPFPDGRRRQGRVRYHYRYRELPRLAWLVRGLRPLNGLQQAFHAHLTYGPRLGTRLRRLPLPAGHAVYCGSQWTTVRRRCAEALAETARHDKALVAYFARTICPDEAFAQTCLVNAGFELANDSKRFVDMSGSRDGHPRMLELADGERLTRGRYHFARKVDVEEDPLLVDWLDRRIAT